MLGCCTHLVVKLCQQGLGVDRISGLEIDSFAPQAFTPQNNSLRHLVAVAGSRG